jgi:hypothetical protein
MNDAHEAGTIPFDDPLAYFLTWTTYGTWLPGDDRGWVEKAGVFRSPDIERQRMALMHMTEGAVTLDERQRSIVEATIKEHCTIRKWHLHAVNCRTNHVHVVVTAKCHPDTVREQLKAWCTRKLKADQRLRSPKEKARKNWWTERGSDRYINDLASLEAAVLYVDEGQ